MVTQKDGAKVLTRCEQLAAECVERFSPAPRRWDASGFEVIDEAWSQVYDYLQEVITVEAAVDILVNFPEEYVTGLFVAWEFEDEHPRTSIPNFARYCVVHVIDKMAGEQA